MHISEGVLSAPVLIAGGVISVAGTFIGLKKIDPEKVMTTSILTAAFFTASLIHVPLGPGSVHLVLSGLLGIILGWAAFPAILVSLILQALLFQFGGMVVLGVNLTILATPAVIVHYLYKPLFTQTGLLQGIGLFTAGAAPILFSSLLTALALMSTDEGFLKSAILLTSSHIPLMLIEGFITLFALTFLQKVQPEILNS